MSHKSVKPTTCPNQQTPGPRNNVASSLPACSGPAPLHDYWRSKAFGSLRHGCVWVNRGWHNHDPSIEELVVVPASSKDNSGRYSPKCLCCASKALSHSVALVTCSWEIDPDRSVRNRRILPDRLDRLECLERDPLRRDPWERCDLRELLPRKCP